ncbi:hypothetical protein LTR35_017140 [Friedmanniomyces endolithicus]|uniref:Uncharacterized protein n=1 Tax=Friedmanniomyces endolithicus TaxID=329885 RepID=A0AAN6F5T9_9PEZI|nr:hypothetical protein LTR35_017140 [Friedmanniomyces endolithicus]KAK0291517.1 hypothetical protein LTS00_008208 [Friedmanniomyces endolithicus]KAK0305291.1 hypothetical protein LTR82_016849 [Friedmanniomyces endolithicus]KAK0995154.1 hypothetical protein LTR54_010662 [Friedmanniomyces endolithicus]
MNDKHTNIAATLLSDLVPNDVTPCFDREASQKSMHFYTCMLEGTRAKALSRRRASGPTQAVPGTRRSFGSEMDEVVVQSVLA